MTTPKDICLSSLKKAGILGVGQSALAEDINDAFTDLNDMLAQWQRKRWLIWHLVDYAFSSTGAESYTVGPGGNFDIAARPDRIESAFFRQTTQSQPNQIDYPLEIIEAREDYNAIRLKQLQTFPQYLFYDSAYPTGLVYPWPVLQPTIYELHITVKDLVGSFSSLTQSISLPPEYMAAMKWNLARKLRLSYRLPPDEELNGEARESLNVIRGANTQVPRARMPTDLVRNGLYNIFSDEIY